MRQCAGVGVAVGVWQSILPVLSRPLISVTGPLICTAGSSWHFLSQRQYARTRPTTNVCRYTWGHTAMHTYPCVPGLSQGHKGTLQKCPTMVSHHRVEKHTHTHWLKNLHTCAHTGACTIKGKHTPKVLTGDPPMESPRALEGTLQSGQFLSY